MEPLMVFVMEENGLLTRVNASLKAEIETLKKLLENRNVEVLRLSEEGRLRRRQYNSLENYTASIERSLTIARRLSYQNENQNDTDDSMDFMGIDDDLDV